VAPPRCDDRGAEMMNKGKTMRATNCPGREQLRAFVRGAVSPDVAEAIIEHLERCSACETTIERLERGPDTLIAACRHPVAAHPFAEEPQCGRAVARVEEFAGVEDLVWAKPPARGESPARGEVSAEAGEPPGLEATESLAEPPFPSRMIREYQLIAPLGKGGMGTVYRARHTKLKRVVALKVLPAERMRDARAIARFEREMEAVGKLEHPHIVRALDAGERDGTHYLVMEYIEGIDLKDLSRRLGPLPIAAACELIRQAAVGLQAAHERGLVHRDIKPSNLMLCRDGLLKILDLGLALLHDEQSAGEEMTGAGQTMGTADYMAPEQCSDSHAVDIRADIYALGCTLFKLLTGQPPYSGPGYETAFQKMTAHVRQPFPSLAGRRANVPPELLALLERMVSKQPARRPATPAEVAVALEPLTAGCDLLGLLERVPPVNQPLNQPLTAPPASLAETDNYRSSALVETAPAQPSRLSAGRWFGLGPRPVLIGLALAAILACIVVLTIRTPRGTLVIETHDPSVQIAVSRGGDLVEVADEENDWTVRLKQGQYQLKVRGGNDQLVLDKDTVTVTHDSRVKARVTLARAADAEVGHRPAGASSDPGAEPADRNGRFTHPALKEFMDKTIQDMHSKFAPRMLYTEIATTIERGQIGTWRIGAGLTRDGNAYEVVVRNQKWFSRRLPVEEATQAGLTGGRVSRTLNAMWELPEYPLAKLGEPSLRVVTDGGGRRLVGTLHSNIDSLPEVEHLTLVFSTVSPEPGENQTRESFQHLRSGQLPDGVFPVDMPLDAGADLKYGGRFHLQAFLRRPKAGFFRVSNEWVWTGARLGPDDPAPRRGAPGDQRPGDNRRAFPRR